MNIEYDKIYKAPYHNNGGDVCGYKVDKSDLDNILQMLRKAEQERDQYKAELAECSRLVEQMQAAEHQKNIELESLRAQLSVKSEQLRMIDEQKPCRYLIVDQRSGTEDIIDSINDLSDWDDVQITPLYEQKPIINVWPNAEYGSLVENNKMLIGEINQLRAKIKEAQEPVAVIGSTFLLCWIGNGPIAPIIEKHNLKVGDKLYASPAIPD